MYEVRENSGQRDQNNCENLEEYHEEILCGFGPFKPKWLQKLASKKSYMLVYGLIGMADLAVASYFAATITTIEKRFKIPSKTSGILMSAWDTGFLCAAFWLAYLGSKGHKTRWVASGTLVIAVACFMRMLPHFLYGPGQDALQLTLEYGANFTLAHSNISEKQESQAHVCRSQLQPEEDCSPESSSSAPVYLFYISIFILGAGNSMYNTLGLAYLDDNVRKNKTPLFIGIWQLMRMVGPTIGYYYASYTLTQYVEGTLHPIITPKDPRWIGDWWQGYITIGLVYIILAMLMALFPKKLPRAAQRMKAEADAKDGIDVKQSKVTSFSDLKKIVKRLLKNRILVLNSFSSVLFVLGTIAYWAFMPKYMETQYKQTAAMSSFITGSVGLFSTGFGILASAIAITKFKPKARSLAAWNVLVEFLDVIAHLSYGFIVCTSDDLQGQMKDDYTWELVTDCNSDCECGTTVKYAPVCSSDGSKTFFSPCYAGCTHVDNIDFNSTVIFTNCSCIGDDGQGWATDGACYIDCSTNLIVFLTLRCVMDFLSASGRAGNAIIQFRCVKPEDKSVSIGLTEVLLCSLCYVPGPILSGIIVDFACIVWRETCGKTGNCWLYDGQRLSFLLNISTAGLLVTGTLIDIGVWYYAKDLEIYEKETALDKDSNKKKKSRWKSILDFF